MLSGSVRVVAREVFVISIFNLFSCKEVHKLSQRCFINFNLELLGLSGSVRVVAEEVFVSSILNLLSYKEVHKLVMVYKFNL